MVGGPSIDFTKEKQLLMKFLLENQQTHATLVGIDASQLYPHAMCQPMSTGFFSRQDIDSETGRFSPRKKTRIFEFMVVSFFSNYNTRM